MLKVENLSFSYGANPVLKNVDFCVEDGEFVAVLGANGAGKSTLFKVICGLEKPQKGGVLLSGKPLGGYSPAELAKIRSALMQDGEFNFESSVLDFVLLGRYARGGFFASKEDVFIAQNALSAVGMSGFEGRVFTRLSGGERRRVELARALCQIGACGRAGTLLMLDEPSMGLSPILVSEIFNIIKEVSADGTTVLLVEQNAKKALSIANRAYVLETGKIVLEGDAKELMNDEQVKKAYLGE